MAASGLAYGPLGESCVHLCVDMQRLFADGSPWATPWLPRVLPQVERLVAHRPRNTIFTRFIPARQAGDGVGAWRRYYQRWASMTLDAAGSGIVALMPSLQRFVPPAHVVDKAVYSPWTEGQLDSLLSGTPIDTLVVTGTETDICVLATVLGAVDRGYRVIIATDALASSADETHDALMTFYHDRLSLQVEVADTETILTNWN